MMGNGRKRIPKDLQDRIDQHERQAGIYAEAMMNEDFESNRIKWAAELVKIARLQKEIDKKVKVNNNPREGNYISI